MPTRTIRLLSTSFPDDPGFDTGLSHALLMRASAGDSPETVRLYVPGRTLAFGKRDVTSPGFGRAVAAARDAGFTPVVRLAGGRAAVFHEQTLAFSWIVPTVDPPGGIRSRFEWITGQLVSAFTRLGVVSDVGEIPGEYCPGEYSIHHAGRFKIVGVGQRLVKGAAHVGGVIVVRCGDLVRSALLPVYEELGLAWDPRTAGSLSDIRPDVTIESVRDALVAELAGRATVISGDPGAATLDLARQMAADHLVGPGGSTADRGSSLQHGR